MFSIRISLCHFLSCVIFLTVSGLTNRPGVRTLLTTRGLNFLRKLAVPVILKKLNNLEIPPISGNVDLILSNLNYRFKNITLSEVKIPDSHISVLDENGLSVQGTKITFTVNELWNYKINSWPFISDSGTCTVTAKQISLNILIGASKGISADEPSVYAKKCNLHIGKIHVEFHGGASFLYNIFMLFIKEPLKDQLEEVICRAAIKAVNKEISSTLRSIPDEVQVGNVTLKSNNELVRPPQFHTSDVEIDAKGEFQNVDNPQMPPYTPAVLPPIRNEHSKMMYMWITAYTINTILFSVNHSGSEQYMFYSKDLPQSIRVKLTTDAFIFIVPPLYDKYPDKDMAIGYHGSSPTNITLNPSKGFITKFGKMTFYVILNENTLVDCFTLYLVEKAYIDRVIVRRKDEHSYIGLKLSNTETDVTLLESHIGNFDLTLLHITVDILSQFIVTRYISPMLEEGVQLLLPTNIRLTNSNSVVEKNSILISTDFMLNGQGEAN